MTGRLPMPNSMTLWLAAICVWPGFVRASTQPEQDPVSDSPPTLRISDRLSITKAGGIAGQLRSDDYTDPESGRKLIAFVTPSGGQILIEKGRAKVQPRTDLVDRAYESELEKMPDSAEAHREMAAKMSAQPGGKSRWAAQIEYHLRRLIELDPNDDRARTQLGQIRIDNHWVDERQFLNAHGYVRDSSKWRSRQELARQAGKQSSRTKTGAALAAYSRFRNRLPQLNPAAAAAELKSIACPELIERLYNDAQDETDPQIRRMLLEAIATQKSYVAANALMIFAIFHPDAGVRDFAFTLLTQSGFDLDGVAVRAASMLSQVKKRDEVNQIALFLGEIGSRAPVLQLINAVVTEHEEANPEATGPGRMNFSLVGGNVQGFGMNNEPTTRRVSKPNPAVIDSLRRLTGSDFGSDQAAWRRWYTENYTLAGTDIHRDN